MLLYCLYVVVFVMVSCLCVMCMFCYMCYLLFICPTAAMTDCARSSHLLCVAVFSFTTCLLLVVICCLSMLLLIVRCLRSVSRLRVYKICRAKSPGS